MTVTRQKLLHFVIDDGKSRALRLGQQSQRIVQPLAILQHVIRFAIGDTPRVSEHGIVSQCGFESLDRDIVIQWLVHSS